MTQTPILEEARRLRLAGSYGRAELICRELIDKNPIDALALGLLGQCLAEAGDPRAATHFIELALSLAPENADVRLNSAALREAKGDLAGAIDDARKAARLSPGKFEALATLGNLLGKAGDYRGAADALHAACRLNPRHPGAALLLAAALMELGEDPRAERALAALDETARKTPQALRIGAHLARRRSDWPRLVETARAFLDVAPDSDEARLGLAFGLAAQGFYDDAAETYHPLAERDPPNAEHLAAMGRYVLGARRVDDARHWFERALAADAASAEASYGLARIAAIMGDLAGAEEMARRAISFDPRFAEAYGQLAEVAGGRLTESEFDALARLAADETLASDKRAIAGFAYGEALHHRRDWDRAFAAWSNANALKSKQMRHSPAGGYDRAATEQTAAALKRLFASDPDLPSESGAAPTPIFIIGMPRSGTSLLEAALSAHPDIAGCGEVPALPFILTEFLEWADKAQRDPSEMPDAMRASWRKLYFDQAAQFSARSGAPYVADKQPSNFLSVGLIRHLFPEAKIIHIRRNPIETGFSIFRRNFSSQWAFATSLEFIGHYYGEYAGLMRHWDETFGERFAFVQYEKLVDDFAAELRRLIDYCGLPWSETCLDFQSAERPVITFSAAQVRKPVSKAHFGSANPYKDRLAPLESALIGAGVDLETGSLALQS